METHRFLVERWTLRRDRGEGRASPETLTAWIEQATERLLAAARKEEGDPLG